MAKSSARKCRERMVRQGKLDPSMHRRDWNGIKPITRMKEGKRRWDYKDCDYNRVLKIA